MSAGYKFFLAKLSSFEPKKLQLRQLLIYFFSFEKSPAKAYHLLVEVFGEPALSERHCRRSFFKLKNGEFEEKNLAER